MESSARFCPQCGAATGQAPFATTPPRSERLYRPRDEQKIAGVCAGFARYMGVDVTLIRILWIVLVVWPIPLIGVIAYIVAWIVMPVGSPAMPAPVPAAPEAR
jgi:phage shock protein C